MLMKYILSFPPGKSLCQTYVCEPHFGPILSDLYSSRDVYGVVCKFTSTMVIPPITHAFVAALAFSGLNASVGYFPNILNIPVAQVILIRSVSRERTFR